MILRDPPQIEPAHSRFGGSIAARVLRCPASVGLVAKVPAHLRRSSTYADRGVALHTAMSLLIECECTFDDLIGAPIENYTITFDDIENALLPAYAVVDALLAAPDAEYYLEQRVQFPTVAGAFGTVDLLVRVNNTIHVVDFKFGSGVRVLALYADGDEDVLNAQLMYYAVAARHSFPEFFAGVDNIVLTIVQPQSIDLDAEPISTVTVTHAELDAFIEIYRGACAEARAPAPRLQRGDHCRFCAARPICPAHTGPLLDLAQFIVPTPSTGDYHRLLADGLNLVDALKDISKALHDQAKKALHAGDIVPGYALSAGRAVRQWRNEATAAPDLLKLGLARDDVLIETLRSPKQVETRAKARGVQVPKELIASTRSGVSLTRAENVRASMPGRSEIARTFAAALKAFEEAPSSRS